METQLQQISDQQQQAWDKNATGWGKWHTFMMDYMRTQGEAIIRALQPEPSDRVLDVAAGTGEPGLSIAPLVAQGSVVITDLSDKMLDVARANALKQQIRNVEFIPCDASELPFADASFDKVSCRLGFMYFPDLDLAAREMRRVLRPGGRLATCVWNPPPGNQWVSAVMTAIGKHITLSPPPPGAPGMFRCSKPGLMKELLEGNGFRDVQEEVVSGLIRFGTILNYWNFMQEMAPPVVAALAGAGADTKQAIYDELEHDLMEYKLDTALTFSSTVISATR